MKFEIKAQFSGVTLFTAELDAKFDTASERAKLGEATKAAYLSSAYLRGADLRGANLSSAYLRGADLRGANLSSVDLSSVDLRGANLSSADLSSAYLRGADLSSANLSSAYLRGACLRGANLRGANLSSVDLSSADLSRADLRGANLRGAYLRGADLRGADLRGAKWTDGIAIEKHPLDFGLQEYQVWILDSHMQIGCELHTLAEWEAFDNERIARMDGATARRFWAVHKDWLLACARAHGRSFETIEPMKVAS